MYKLFVPTGDDLTTPIEKGKFVKLCFTENKEFESMWVKVSKIKGENFEGTLSNDPIGIPSVQFGDVVQFNYEHIREFYKEDKGGIDIG